MKKHYIIDGYNLGFKIPAVARLIKAGDTDIAVRKIIQKVQQLIKQTASDALIIFDGRGHHSDLPQSFGNVRIAFSRKPRTADDEIRDFVRNRESLSNWIVVSSDNEIRFTAQDHGAVSLKAEAFLKQATKSAGKHPSEQKKYNPRDIDVDYWMKQFRSNEDDDED